MKLPQLPVDKANHLITGAVLGIIAKLCSIAAGHPEMANLAAPAVAGFAGLAKEFSDYTLNKRAGKQIHGIEAADFVATLAGGLMVVEFA